MMPDVSNLPGTGPSPLDPFKRFAVSAGLSPANTTLLETFLRGRADPRKLVLAQVAPGEMENEVVKYNQLQQAALKEAGSWSKSRIQTTKVFVDKANDSFAVVDYRGITVTSIGLRSIIKDMPEHDLLLLIGSTLDHGESLSHVGKKCGLVVLDARSFAPDADIRAEMRKAFIAANTREGGMVLNRSASRIVATGNGEVLWYKPRDYITDEARQKANS